jgi:hypothetical protein
LASDAPDDLACGVHCRGRAHLSPRHRDPNQFVHFLKNLAIAGGLLQSPPSVPVRLVWTEHAGRPPLPGVMGRANIKTVKKAAVAA